MEVPSGGPKVVGRNSTGSRSGRKIFREFQKWSEDTPEGLEMVGRPFQSQEVVGRP